VGASSNNARVRLLIGNPTERERYPWQKPHGSFQSQRCDTAFQPPRRPHLLCWQLDPE
jgi:hypothetical protein